ncbi:MAG: hypothetical protein C4308_05035 [Chitinophagaceae bacterium]
MLLMKRLLPGVFLPLSLQSVVAQSASVQQQAIILKRQIERTHYSPWPVDDSLFSTIFSTFIKLLDPHENILLASDVTQLSAFRYKLDDELNGKSWQFYDLASSVYQIALKIADSIIQFKRKGFFFKKFEPRNDI